MEVELIINSDGTFLVERGNKEFNDIIRSIFMGETTDDKGLDLFLSMTDNVQVIIGNKVMCG